MPCAVGGNLRSKPALSLQDAWSDQKGQIHLDAQQDYQLLEAQRTPQGLTLLFRRPFSTCDPRDYLIEVGGGAGFAFTAARESQPCPCPPSLPVTSSSRSPELSLPTPSSTSRAGGCLLGQCWACHLPGVAGRGLASSVTRSLALGPCGRQPALSWLQDGTVHLVYGILEQPFSSLEDINTSDLQTGLQRVQLLKPNISVPALPADVRTMEVHTPNVSIPGQETTYWCYMTELPAGFPQHHIVMVRGGEASCPGPVPSARPVPGAVQGAGGTRCPEPWHLNFLPSQVWSDPSLPSSHPLRSSSQPGPDTLSSASSRAVCLSGHLPLHSKAA